MRSAANLKNRQNNNAVPADENGVFPVVDDGLADLSYHREAVFAMVLDELNAYRDCIQDLNAAKALQISLNSAVTPGAQNLTGLPHAPGYKNKLGNLIPAIMDLSETIAILENRKAQTETEIQAFICSIPEFRVRTLFSLRFLEGLSWRAVAAALGGGNSVAGVKAACYRYLKSCNAMSRRDA